MPRLKVLSGPEVIGILQQFGFSVVGQRGSHIKLRRVDMHGRRETLTIPSHKIIDRGTLRAIVRQATRYVPASELQPFFYVSD